MVTINKLSINNQNYLAFTYPRQCTSQPCYIELDCDDEELSADYSSEIGNAVPGYVWHNRAIRFQIPALTADAANSLMEDLLERCQKIVDGYEQVWNGSNHVGKYTSEAQGIIDAIHYELSDYYVDEDSLAVEPCDEEES